jgi:hypothetical protein
MGLAALKQPRPSGGLARPKGWARDNSIGFDIEVRFPIGPDSQRATLPRTDRVGTAPLTANLRKGRRANGAVFLTANAGWTADGELAAPGNYVGTVVLTVAAFP